MKKVILSIITVFLAACSLSPNISAAPTETKLVIPLATQITVSVTATPNILTVTPTQTPTVSPTPDGTYTVQAGETLGEIAAKFGMPYGYLADVNNIPNPNLIYVGQVLTIPV